MKEMKYNSYENGQRKAVDRLPEVTQVLLSGPNTTYLNGGMEGEITLRVYVKYPKFVHAI